MSRLIKVFSAVGGLFFVLAVATSFSWESDSSANFNSALTVLRMIVLFVGAFSITEGAVRRLSPPFDLLVLPTWYVGSCAGLLAVAAVNDTGRMAAFVPGVLTLGLSARFEASISSVAVGSVLAVLQLLPVVLGIRSGRACVARDRRRASMGSPDPEPSAARPAQPRVARYCKR